MKYLDAVSLFSGAMGLDIGLEKVGRLIEENLGTVRAQFNVIAYVENDPACKKTINANIAAGRTNDQNAQVYGDIRDISDPRQILEEADWSGDLSLLVGGPPCQSFSTVGRRGTVQDPRGSLPWEFVRFVRELQPKFFLMENVRGIMSAAIRHRPLINRGKGKPPLEDDEKPGSVVKLLLSDFEKEGYHVDVFEVNAVNYGAPQLRERVLFIGNRFNKLIEFPKPTHGFIEKCYTKSKLCENFSGIKPFRTLRDAIGDLHEENPAVSDFSLRKKKFLAMVPPGGNWRSLPVEIQKESMGKAWFAKGGRSGWWRRLSFDLPSPCLLTLPTHSGTSLCHPFETRALTIKEYARIQEFPDEWSFYGSTSEQYRQIGNAVPVRLGEVAGKILGDGILALSEMENEGGACNYSQGKILPNRKLYIKSHIRTRKWFSNGKAVIRE
jgi:DNA (cytosine-5)-methyltransferase 1